MTESQDVAAYRVWQHNVVRIGGRTVRVATKPGVFGHDSGDVASLLIAEHATVAPGDQVAFLNCGSGLFGAVAAGHASNVMLVDRNVLSVNAATRTLAANGIANGSVMMGQGAAPLPQGWVADVVAIRVPEDRASQRALLEDAHAILRNGGTCYVAGASNEGIKPAAEFMAGLFGKSLVLATRGGHRVVRSTKVTENVTRNDGNDANGESVVQRNDSFQEVPLQVAGVSFTMFTRPGVFSREHLDEATALLAEAMVIAPGERVLDLGCGAGVLGTVAALKSGAVVTMLDADSEAVRCAIRTATAAGVHPVRALVSDVASAVEGERFDVVVTNPPFHVGRLTNLAVPRQFILESYDLLRAGGRLQLVANRTLPYERLLSERFGNVTVLADGARFKVLESRR